jgi:hypothetical protein
MTSITFRQRTGSDPAIESHVLSCAAETLRKLKAAYKAETSSCVSSSTFLDIQDPDSEHEPEFCDEYEDGANS